jgi:hypoxanthine phosphoribosyltransferase
MANDCGAQFVTTRGGWIIANICGHHKILVAAETHEAAVQAALSRELDLKHLCDPDMPSCKNVLIVDPHGAAGGPSRVSTPN